MDSFDMRYWLSVISLFVVAFFPEATVESVVYDIEGQLAKVTYFAKGPGRYKNIISYDFKRECFSNDLQDSSWFNGLHPYRLKEIEGLPFLRNVSNHYRVRHSYGLSPTNKEMAKLI
jgi:hypothetical protein